MPLTKGKNRPIISENIRKLISEGKPNKRAVSIALSIARRMKKK